jgi:hypothetical protein
MVKTLHVIFHIMKSVVAILLYSSGHNDIFKTCIHIVNCFEGRVYV